MSTPRRKAAARTNGAKSRGPKTNAGRRASSANALSHGLNARSTIVLEYEDPEEFHRLLADHRAIYLPTTPAENDLVDQMAAARWRIRRIWTIETALLDAEVMHRKPQVRKEYSQIDGAIELALAFRGLADESRSLHLVSRYESRIYRMYDRAYTALRELQQRPKQKIRNEPTDGVSGFPPMPLAISPCEVLPAA